MSPKSPEEVVAMKNIPVRPTLSARQHYDQKGVGSLEGH
jgi:hypothetical protein